MKRTKIMHIHTVSSSETVYQIARKYGIHPTKLIETNSLKNPDKLTVGQKLIILTPTKTYTVRGGDTLKRIATRFGVSYRALLRNNPALEGTDKIYPEEILAVKYDTPNHGIALLNGYCYSDCSYERLKTILPYLNYVTISSAVNETGNLNLVMDDRTIAEKVKSEGRIPLLRIYDKRSFEEMAKNINEYAEKICDLYQKRGHSGITFGAYNAAIDERFEELLFCIKKAILSRGGIFFLEVDGNRNFNVSDIPDANIFSYTKCCDREIPSFEEGEKKLYTELAEKQDSSKIMIELTPFAYHGKKEVPITDTVYDAARTGKEIEYDSDRMICSFKNTAYKNGRGENVTVIFEAPENIKAKLDLCGELGFMGMSIDIMRTPIEYMMMINSTFSCGVDYL